MQSRIEQGLIIGADGNRVPSLLCAVVADCSKILASVKCVITNLGYTVSEGYVT